MMRPDSIKVANTTTQNDCLRSTSTRLICLVWTRGPVRNELMAQASPKAASDCTEKGSRARPPAIHWIETSCTKIVMISGARNRLNRR